MTVPEVWAGATLNDLVKGIDDPAEYLRAVWRSIEGLNLGLDSALISFAIGSDATAPDYIIRELMEGTVENPLGAVAHGCFDGHRHRWNRKLNLPGETGHTTLVAIIAALGTATGRSG